MSELGQELKRIKAEGKLNTVRSRGSHKVSHKANVPKIAKKWSLKQNNYVLLRFGFFWELMKNV